MKGIIYKYTSPSGKCYIGQTINEDTPSYGTKPVYQYTLDYKLVRIWESGCQAEREAGYDSTKISRVCNHKLPYYGKKNEDKYLWSFSELHDVETKD